ncbi:hypothetical protein [Methanobacterium subterraneum]|uniref:hypothetical protein n=1 Tax=Methanobacterium subterraneum TaxID=59277 RepID=UPI001F1AFD65|nr:hypothetical protein [Methanobacterium subterraneum]
MTNLRCPKCGVEYPENSDRCQFCGNPKNPFPVNDRKKGQKVNSSELKHEPETNKSHFVAKLLGFIGIIFFIPLTLASGIYLLTRGEKKAKYWGIAYIVIGVIFWAIGAYLVYTMGYDKVLATYNLTNYSYNFTNYGLKF